MMTYFIIFILVAMVMVIVAGVKLSIQEHRHFKMMTKARARENRRVEKLRKELETISIQEVLTYQKWHELQVDMKDLELDYLLLADKYHTEVSNEA